MKRFVNTFLVLVLIVCALVTPVSAGAQLPLTDNVFKPATWQQAQECPQILGHVVHLVDGKPVCH